MARRLVRILGLAFGLVLVAPTAAFACGGLVAPGHAEVLRKATTLAAWHNGFEHYVTGFQFAGTARSFGYIVPLPGVPLKIEKGGEWTLERLEREIDPVAERAAFGAVPASADGVQVIQQVRIDALDITVVRGGGSDVAAWASEHGFDLTPDTPEVLGHYSSAGAVFALAKFDAEAAADQGLIEGEGATIHFTVPTSGPWIPLRILALGKAPAEVVEADLFVLTDERPAVAPALWTMPGVTLKGSAPAAESLLSDLGSDRGMAWLPRSGMWLTAFQMSSLAESIDDDLSIDGGGPPRQEPTAEPVSVPGPGPAMWPWAATSIGSALLVLLFIAATPRRAGPRAV